ncbi:hypothetical protein BH11PSE4_BH11PSE4_35270 [soil metagenome]
MSDIREALWAVVPQGLYEYFKIRRPARQREQRENHRLRFPLELSARNSDLLDIHKGQRCFILCNGPSVKRQNIAWLKNEHVLSVSSGYHHPDYADIQPEYHFIPQLTYGSLTPETAVTWFREMDSKLGRAKVFLNYTEEQLVRESRLFSGRDVRYLTFSGFFTDYAPLALPDIAGRIPSVQSVAIMCLMAAMHMGFEKIYLLGTDHDHFLTGEYKYFFDPTILKGLDPSANSEGNLVGALYDEFSALSVLWQQYRAIRLMAEHHGIKIFNATAGGALDEFSRVEFETLIR